MKTPKRHHELTTMEHISTERVWDYSQEQVNTQRWKRKNRVKQLKNTIRKVREEMEDINRSRIILRNHLILKRNANILRARSAETENEREMWLGATREQNLFLQLTMSREEKDAEWRGEDIMPHALKFSEEEKRILHDIVFNCSHAHDTATEAE